MAYFLVQVSYTPEAWAAMIKSPQDRTESIRPAVEKLGGSMERFYLSFGDYDVAGIVELPDNTSAAAFAVAISAGGSCKAIKTTPLLPFAEGVEALKRAGTSGYKPIARA